MAIAGQFYNQNVSLQNLLSQEYTPGMELVRWFHRDVIMHSVCRIAVPGFFILSGALFFRNYDNSQFIEKLSTRIKSLVLPYLTWNVLGLLVAIILTIPFLEKFVLEREVFDYTIGSLIAGVFHHKYQPLFWYVFYLILFVILSPILYLVYKRKTFCILSFILAFSMYCIGYRLPSSIFFRTDPIFYYSIGAFIGCHYSKIIFLEMYTRKSKVLFLLLFILCSTLLYLRFGGDSVHDQTPVGIILVTVSSACLFTLVSETKIPYFNKVRALPFIIYASHMYTVALFAKIIPQILPLSFGWNYAITLILSTFLSIVCAYYFSILCQRHFPLFWRFLSGGR